MATHPRRELAIRRCLVQGEAPAVVASELGVVVSTRRRWLQLGRLGLDPEESGQCGVWSGLFMVMPAA